MTSYDVHPASPVTAYVVRPAAVEDARRLGVVHTQVWREAYAGVMPADYLAALDPARSGERWQQMLTTPVPGRAINVALADEEVVGMAIGGLSRDEPADPPYELYAINVLAAHHGTGVADRLFETTLAEVAGGGPVSLWVVDSNARARAFYRRYGFEPDGLQKGHDGTGVHEVRLVR